MTMGVSMFMFAQSYDALWKQYKGFADKDQPKSALVILEKIKTKAEKEKSYGNLLAALMREVNHQREISNDSGKVFKKRLEERMKNTSDGVMKTLYRLAKGDRINADSLLASPDAMLYKKANGTGPWVPFLTTGKDSKIFNNDLLHVILFEKRNLAFLDSIYGKGNEYVRYRQTNEKQVKTEPVLHANVEKKVSSAKDIKIYFDRVRNLKGIECTIHRVGTKEKRQITKAFLQHSEEDYFNDTLDIGSLQEGRWVVTLRDFEKKVESVSDTIIVSDTRLIQLSLPNKQKRYVFVNAITGEETTPDSSLIDRRHWNNYTYNSNKGYKQYTDIYTDRAIYRPGQKIEAAIIRSSVTNGIETSVVAGEKMHIRLLDSKGEKKAEKYAVTDTYGTAAVDFTLPEGDIRSGYWQLLTDGASASFRVEEYKRPTFEVKLKKNKDEYVVGDTAIVSGIAKTYNGIPQQNSKVVVSYYDKKDTLFTDNDGSFDIKVVIKDPFKQLNGRKIYYPWWRYVRVAADVTDGKGETQSAECHLYVKHINQPETQEEPKAEVKKDTTKYHIYYTVFAGNKVLESSKIYTDTASFANAYTYKPEYGDGAMICYAWCKDDVIQSAEKVVRRPLPSNKLKVEWGTFRDKVAPGAKEVWTLKVRPEEKNCQLSTVNCQLTSVLYDASLDGIRKHSWNTHDRRHLAIPSSSWYTPYTGHIFMSGRTKDWVKWRDFDFTHINSECIINPRYGVFDCFEEAAPRLMMAKGVSNSKAMRLGSLSVTGATADGVVMKASEVADMTEEVIPMRTNFGETAFFYPKVETDDKGEATLEFTLPESLTSWRFMGLAHDKEMRVGMIDTTVIAQKQLMVHPNMPRFLRIGDKATITTNVTNNSVEESQITVKCYVGRKNSSKKEVVTTQRIKLKAGETAPVTFPIEAGTDTTTLTCKIVASNGKYNDGEQHEIPVLGIKQTIEPAITIYKSPDDIMMAALPDLCVPKSRCAICLSNALYANVLTAHLRDILVSPANDNVMMQLLNLQRGDGSFAWYPGMEGNKYMTMAVLKTFARMQKMTGGKGIHTALASAVDKAYEYMQKAMDKEVAEMKKYKTNFLSNTALDWMYALAINKERNSHKSATYKYFLRLLEDATNKADMATKAVAAIVMDNSRKSDEAKTYAESIKQHTVYREDMGRYFDSYRTHYSWCDYRIPSQVMAIEALYAITPEDNCTITQMQRWLVSSKRTQSWDNPVNTVNAVSAFYLKTKPCEEEIAKMYRQPSAEELEDIIKVKREVISGKSNLSVGDKIKVRITIEADRDYDFVSVIDNRAACLEPVHQLSGYRYGCYQQMKDNKSEFFFNQLSKGTHVIETEYYVTRTGEYTSGSAIAVCTYAPEYRGTSEGSKMTISR